VEVYGTNAIFTMYGGSITGNVWRADLPDGAGGVHLDGEGALYMKGGSITGNTIKNYNLGDEPSDIFAGAETGVLELSGSAQVGVITLEATSVNPSITVGSGWSSSGITKFHLCGGFLDSLSVTISSWYNASKPKTVVKAASGYTLTSSDIAKCPRGEFRKSDIDHAAGNYQSLSGGSGNDYYLGTSGANMGKLLKQ